MRLLDLALLDRPCVETTRLASTHLKLIDLTSTGLNKG